MNTPKRFFRLILLTALLSAACTPVFAAVQGQIGPYRLQIFTEPSVIPVGKARLRIDVTDSSGKPVEGLQIRSLVQMPRMPMGERESLAQPIPGQPGSYTADVTFAMSGGYDASISIRGPLGEASGRITLETGQNTGNPGVASSGFSIRPALPWILGAALLVVAALLVARVRRTPQWVSRGTIGGVLLIVVVFALSRWAIDHWRRPGSMTPLEAQSMEMNTPAPPGIARVTLAEADRGPVERTVWYTGQAVAYNEQDVVARTEGWVTLLPFYVGQSVKADEVVAHLDISELQSIAEVDRMRAEFRGKNDALEASRAEVTAAGEERSGAEAELAAKQSMIVDAEAMVSAAEADRLFWQQQSARNKTLLDKGAISPEEYQREVAMAANAAAKVQQAQARLEQTRSEVRSAQAMLRRADALIAAADRKRSQMAADVTAAEAAVRSAQSRAGMEHGAASPEGTAANSSHVEIRTHLAGVVVERRVSLGQHVGPGQSILKIAQMDPIRLQANVAHGDLARIRVGSRMIVRDRDATAEPLVARVTSITPVVDPTTRLAIVEAVVPNRAVRFFPGQSLSMDISTGRSEDAVRVPIGAVHVRTQIEDAAAGGYVWIVEETGANQYRVSPVDVTTGVSDGVYVQVLSGLEPGQKVVMSGGDYLKRGDTVSVNAGNEAPR